MYQAFPSLLPCNDDLHSDFRTRGLFGRNWFEFLSAEYLRPRAKMTHRICLHFSSMTFRVVRKTERKAQEVCTIKLACLDAAEYRAPCTRLSFEDSFEDVVVREQIDNPKFPDHPRIRDDCIPMPNRGRAHVKWPFMFCFLLVMFCVSGINCPFHASTTCFNKVEEQVSIIGHANRY